MTDPLLLFDGACALCTASVRFVLARERAPVLRFAPLDGTTAASLRAAHPRLDQVDSLVLVERGRVHVRSAAALRIAGYLRWPWPLVRVAWLVPRPLRDRLYDLIARHRHRLMRATPWPGPPAAAARFLP